MAARLRSAGCVAADEEADELVAVAAGDAARLEHLVQRRCDGEPLAWLTGSVVFCGETILVRPGVYVPRWQSEPMARDAAERLPDGGVAIDLCTGAGALAVVMMRRRPSARVLATEIDPIAADCARAHRVEVHVGDLTAALPADLFGVVDVVTGVVPYVPTEALHLLPCDVVTYEPAAALDGGPQGVAFLRRAITGSAPLLRPGGSLFLEVGGEQGDVLTPILEQEGYEGVTISRDEDGDVRALSARRA